MNINSIENPRLRNFVCKKLGLPRYGDYFDSLLVETFIREQFVDGLSPEEFLEDLENFSNSINSITFGKLDKNVMGCVRIYLLLKKIVFNKKYFDNLSGQCSIEKYCISFFETFAHEALHGMQIKNGKNRAEGYNTKIKNRSHALYEICTQATAAKIARNRTIEQFYNNEILTGDGYSEEIFAVPLIASAFGVTEQDVLKYGKRERSKLVNALNVNIGNCSVTASLIDRIEEQLEFIHSASYPDSNQIEYKSLSISQKAKIIGKAMENLLSLCEEVLYTRVRNIPLEYNHSITEIFKYDQKKINYTIDNQWKRYRRYFKIPYHQIFLNINRGGKYSIDLYELIEFLNALEKPKNKRFLQNTPDIISAIRRGDKDYLYSLGLEIRLDGDLTYHLLDTSEEMEGYIHRDYNDFRNWDNSEIFRIISEGYLNKNPERSYYDVRIWDDITTSKGSIKLKALQYCFLNQRRQHFTKGKQILFELLDQNGGHFSEEFYNLFSDKGIKAGGINMFPKGLMRQHFNCSYDQIFVASLIADRFTNKAFFNNGVPKPLEDKKEIALQKILEKTAQKYDLNQVKTALKMILLNDDYGGISGEQNKNEMAMYGRMGIFDIISEPLLSELICDRTIIPEKRRDLDYAIATDNKDYPNQGAQKLAAFLYKYKCGENGSNLYNLFTFKSSIRLEYAFKTQKDFEDMLGIICNEYSRQNYQNPYSEDNYRNPDIAKALDELGPDQFRENIINAFFDKKTFAIDNTDYLFGLRYDPNDYIKRLAEPYVRTAIQIGRNYDNDYRNEGFLQVQPVSLIDIKSMVDKYYNNNPKGFLERISDIKNHLSTFGRGGVAVSKSSERDFEE